MKKNKKKNKKKKLIYIVPIFISIIMIIGIVFCFVNTMPISNKDSKVILKIKEGSTIRDVSDILKEKKLIRNRLFMLAYIKINNINGLKAGNYSLNKNMSLKQILSILKE